MSNFEKRMEAMRVESARKHEEIIDLLKKLAISMGRAKEVEEWEKWRDLKRAQEASEDIISNPKSQIFITEDCDDGSTPKENLVVACSDEEIVKYPTQSATAQIGEEDCNVEEFLDVLTMEEADITGPIMAVEDEPRTVLRSDPNVIKKDFSNELDGQHSAEENKSNHNALRLQIMKLKWGCMISHGQICTNVGLRQEPVCVQRRTWDPGITCLKILKQHLEDKVFLGGGVMI